MPRKDGKFKPPKKDKMFVKDGTYEGLLTISRPFEVGVTVHRKPINVQRKYERNPNG